MVTFHVIVTILVDVVAVAGVLQEEAGAQAHAGNVPTLFSPKAINPFTEIVAAAVIGTQEMEEAQHGNILRGYRRRAVMSFECGLEEKRVMAGGWKHYTY